MSEKQHDLKTWPVYFNAILSGEKTFEVRKNDRGFHVGDILHLKEFRDYGYGGVQKGYTGNTTKRIVTYMLVGGQFGIEEDYCVMGIDRP
jgi:Domain of unknown function (DUF3850)